MLHSTVRVLVLQLLALFVLFGEAFAAAAHGKTYGPSYTIPYWVNFSLFIILVTFLLRKPFASFWAARRAEIEGSLQAGAQELDKARDELSEVRALQATLESRRAEIRERIENETQNEEKRILSSGRSSAEYVMQSAEQSAESERVRVLSLLRREFSLKLLDGTEQQLRAKVDARVDADVRKRSRGGMSQFRENRRVPSSLQ